MSDLGRCPGCHALVRLVTYKRKVIYLDPDPIDTGRFVVEASEARVWRPLLMGPDVVKRYQSHWVTCARPQYRGRRLLEARDRTVAKAREGL